MYVIWWTRFDKWKVAWEINNERARHRYSENRYLIQKMYENDNQNFASVQNENIFFLFDCLTSEVVSFFIFSVSHICSIITTLSNKTSVLNNLTIWFALWTLNRIFAKYVQNAWVKKEGEKSDGIVLFQTIPVLRIIRRIVRCVWKVI